MSVYQWSTSAASNSSADANIDWSEGQLPSTVNDSARAMMAALAAMVRDQGGYATLGGSGNTFTLTLSQTMTSKVPALLGFFATRSNTGAVTMNVDSTGAFPLRQVSGTELVSGQIVSGSFYIISWNSSTSEWIAINAPPIGNYLLSATAASTYLPFTGGTLTGQLQFNAPSGSFNDAIRFNLSSSRSIYISVTDAASKEWYLYDTALGGTGASRLRSDGSGNLIAYANVTAYSDARLKENVETISNALDLVNRMRGVFYDRIDTGEAGIGVIAQEMEEVIPEVVIPSDGMLTVAYGNLVGVLIEAVKELSAKIDKLEAK